MRKKMFLITAALVAVALTGGVAFAIQGGPRSTPSEHTPTPPDQRGLTAEQATGSYGVDQISQVQAEQKEKFGIFRRPQRASDQIATSVPQLVYGRSGVSTTKYGTNVALARTVSGGPDFPLKSRIQLIPGRDFICVRIPYGPGPAAGAGCDRTAAVEAGYSLTLLSEGSSQADGETLIVGLVPDGIKEVTVVSADGQQSVPVNDNVYTTSVVEARSVSFTAQDGSQVVRDISSG